MATNESSKNDKGFTKSKITGKSLAQEKTGRERQESEKIEFLSDFDRYLFNEGRC